ncbi:MAG TPA: glycoside hydrolase family 31 protein, partial [Spirochaetia bacterium]
PADAVWGLGERAAPLDRRRSGGARGEQGHAGAVLTAPDGPAARAGGTGEGDRAAAPAVTYRFWNRDPGGAYNPGTDPIYITMPVYLVAGDAGCHLVFHDTSFDGSITLGSDAVVRFDGGPCRTYLIAGTPESIVTRFTELTGRPPMPPRWAFGYQHSRWAWNTLAEARRVVEGFRERKLPLGVLHLDIDHMRGYRTLTIDERTFPRLKDFSDDLHAHGTRLVAIVDPGVKTDPRFRLYAEGRKEGVFCALPDDRELHGVVWPGRSAFTDYTSPDAREWWGRQYGGDLSRGIDGFWHDMNEPSCFTAWGSPSFPLCVRHDLEGRGGDHREAHNVYGMLMNRAGYEGLRKLRPDARPFIVTRSGWVGMQRWSWSWTGDTDTTWGALAVTPASVMGLGLCGMPYTGPDIGGFADTPSAELYARWFELASFLPFFRTHRSIHLPDREPWCFGDEVLSAARAAMEARVRLLPYWYTLAWEASRTGLPLVRPIAWAEPGRRDLRAVDDEMLVGRDLLVAPVLSEGATERPVVFPKGTWYRIGTDEVFSGKATVPAPLTAIPVFARAGAIVPTEDEAGLVLHAYAGAGTDGASHAGADGAPCDGVLYSDADDGFGPHRVDRFRIAGSALTWSSEGDFPWPYSRVSLVLHAFHGARVMNVEGAPVPIDIR